MLSAHILHMHQNHQPYFSATYTHIDSAAHKIFIPFRLSCLIIYLLLRLHWFAMHEWNSYTNDTITFTKYSMQIKSFVFCVCLCCYSLWALFARFYFTLFIFVVVVVDHQYLSHEIRYVEFMLNRHLAMRRKKNYTKNSAKILWLNFIKHFLVTKCFASIDYMYSFNRNCGIILTWIRALIFRLVLFIWYVLKSWSD